MADAFTTTSTLSTATAAYERLAYFQLRPQLYFDALADIKPTRQTHPGTSVTFTIYNELAPKVAPLAETVDVDAVAVSDDTVIVTLNEYGSAAITSARVRGTSYLVVSSDVANVIGFNAGISFDSLARNVLLGGDNVSYGGTATDTDEVEDDFLITAHMIRHKRAKLVNRNVQPFNGGFYRAMIAPDVAVDLRSETGAAAWRDPHVYSQPEQIWNGEVGAFEGFAFVETPRLAPESLETGQGGPGGYLNGGDDDVSVYPTLFMGRQALAKTWSSSVSAPRPQVVLGAVTDKLRRFVPVGWYWLGGYGRFREAALERVETASSVGDNG